MNAKQIADELENIYWIQGDGKGKPFQQYADFVRQQQSEIEALKDFAIWLTGCGYDFCQHEYFIKCRDELLIGNGQKK